MSIEAKIGDAAIDWTKPIEAASLDDDGTPGEWWPAATEVRLNCRLLWRNDKSGPPVLLVWREGTSLACSVERPSYRYRVRNVAETFQPPGAPHAIAPGTVTVINCRVYRWLHARHTQVWQLTGGWATCFADDRDLARWSVFDERLAAADDIPADMPLDDLIEPLRSEVAKLREAKAAKADDEGHVPTPHEPVRGVTLWNTIGYSKQTAAHVRIDGGPVVGFLYPSGDVATSRDRDDATYGHEPHSAGYIASEHWRENLRAFRDRVRAERAAASAPKPYTLATWPLSATRVRADLWPAGEWAAIQHVGPEGVTFRRGLNLSRLYLLPFKSLADGWLYSDAAGTDYRPCVDGGADCPARVLAEVERE